MAEFVMKKLIADMGMSEEFTVASSATSYEEFGNDIHPGTRRMLEKQGIPFTRREATPLQKSDYEKYDLFVGMDSANIRNMQRIFGSDPENKIKKLLEYTGSTRDVADPWYTGNFAETWNDISSGCQAMMSDIFTEKR